ncbi:MAG: hypothetical protein JWO82_2195 [Akkermansiaceae bacterium]|nr:hypothetical protein [Akkermansiaceae bacterium]
MGKRSIITAAAALILTATVSSAAVVSFTSSVIAPTDTGTFLDNSGTVLSAVSFGQARSGTFTYNAPGTASNPDPAPVLNGITFVSTAGAINPSGTYYALGQSGGGNMGYDNGRFSNVPNTNPGLFGLVYDVARSSANNIRLTLNVNSLTPGTIYQVQMIFSEINTADSGTTPADRSVQVAAGAFAVGANQQVGTGADGTSAVYAYGPTSGARVVTATFAADSASEAFTFLSGTEGGNSRVSLAGVVISQIPEASTSMLAAAGVAAMAFSRRRKSA